MISNQEHVAKVIFEPKMIYNGNLLVQAFDLRSHLHEDYISVLRMAIEGWQTDMMQIPTRKNRTVYGYAEMSVEEIRRLQLHSVDFDVRETNNEVMRSHAGIFVTVNGEPLIGGQKLSSLPKDISEDFLLLAIKQQLTMLAQKGLHQINK